MTIVDTDEPIMTGDQTSAAPQDLRGKTAVVTGASTGIGLASARRLLAQGARVLITGTDSERLDKAAAELQADADRHCPAGRQVVAGRVDVRDLATLDALADQVRAEFGGLDILVANAGVTYLAPFAQVTAERFDEEMAVNVRGTFFTVQKLAPLLRPGASVVLNTSCLDVLGGAGMSVYAAGKAAVRSLTRSLAAELHPHGVRVNAVAPGPVNTPIYGKLGLTPEQLTAMATQVAGNVPLGRFAEADEIAGVIAFLAGPGSSFMLGAELVVDGGWTQL